MKLLIFIQCLAFLIAISSAYVEDGSGDDGDIEDGSGDWSPSAKPCIKYMLIQQSNPMRNPHIPQCTHDGQFMPMQCNHKAGECWCVTKNGEDIPGTTRKLPEKPNCGIKSGKMSTTWQPGFFQSSTTVKTDKGDDRDIEVVDDTLRKTDSDISIEQPTKLPSDVYPEKSQGDKKTVIITPAGHFWLQPWLLAVVIILGVLILIVIILFLLFIFYRIRKKDEGIYTISNRPPQYKNIIYTKAPVV